MIEFKYSYTEWMIFPAGLLRASKFLKAAQYRVDGVVFNKDCKELRIAIDRVLLWRQLSD